MLCDSQRGIDRHRPVASNPSRECFAGQMLGDINEIVAFAPKIEDLGDVDVPQLLRGKCMLLELLSERGTDALCRN